MTIGVIVPRAKGQPLPDPPPVTQAASLAAVLGMIIRARVAERGTLTEPRQNVTRKTKPVAANYPGAVLLEMTTDAQVFLALGGTPRIYQAASGKRLNTFSPSGGMWAGLAVKQRGPEDATLAGMGRSTGRNPYNDSSGKSTEKAGTRKISNALKLWCVFDRSSVNLLQYTADELTAVRDAMVVLAARKISKAMGAIVEWTGAAPTSPIVQRIVDQMTAGTWSLTESGKARVWTA